MNKYKSMLIAVPVSLKEGLFCIRMWALYNKKTVAHGGVLKVLNLLEIKEAKVLTFSYFLYRVVTSYMVLNIILNV